jgi:hypothetical protein
VNGKGTSFTQYEQKLLRASPNSIKYFDINLWFCYNGELL